MESVVPTNPTKPTSPGRLKFLIGGLLIVAAIVYLIISSTSANAQFFLTIDQLMAQKSSLMNPQTGTSREVRISGAVVGSSIKYDAKTLTLTFDVANIPGDQKVIDAQGGLAEVLHQAVINPNVQRLQVVYNGVKPDLLKDEAQAIMTGTVGSNGVFTATELLLKCPTRYSEAVPNQTSK